MYRCTCIIACCWGIDYETFVSRGSAVCTSYVTPLHSGMKLLITPLLSGLLENDFTRMTEFDDFFKEIEKVNRKKVIPTLYHFYVTSSLTCDTLRERDTCTLIHAHPAA